MKSEKLQFDRSLATDSEATYRLRTKSHLCLDAGIGGTFYSIPVDSYRNFRRILLYAAMRTISSRCESAHAEGPCMSEKQRSKGLMITETAVYTARGAIFYR